MSPRPKEESPSGFIKRIKREMRSKGISLRALAAEAGMDPATLSRILSGKQGIPTDGAIMRLALALMIEPGELFSEADRIPQGRADLRILLRTSSRLDHSAMQKVLKVAKQLQRQSSARSRKKR